MPKATDKKFESDLLELLAKHDQISANYMRDLEIKIKYRQLLTRMKSDHAKRLLSDEYCIGLKSIEAILYAKKDFSVNSIGTRKKRVLIITETLTEAEQDDNN